MSVETTTAKQEARDKFEYQIKSAATKLVALKARAEAGLKKVTDEKWEHSKGDLEAWITAFEKSINEIEAEVRAHPNPKPAALIVSSKAVHYFAWTR